MKFEVITDRSYYEKALEIVRNKQVVAAGYFINRDEDETPTNLNEGEEINNIAASLNYTFPQPSQNEPDVLTTTKLPPLPSKSFEENELLLREDSAAVTTRQPSAASSTSRSSTTFPKIDTRYLPK